MSTKTISLTDTLYDYLLANSLREHPLQRELREETATLELSRMQISPEQAQFMSMLVKLTKARRIIEIGVFTGYSSMSLALALPPDGFILACDINEEWTRIAQRYWRRAEVADKIELRLGPALETLEKLIRKGEQSTFDFAFIDADKTHYTEYYEACLKLIRPGGLIVVDNVLWGGSVADRTQHDADTHAIRELNTHIYSDDRVDISLVPIGDGLTLALKK